jgi:hypothetical protein
VSSSRKNLPSSSLELLSVYLAAINNSR